MVNTNEIATLLREQLKEAGIAFADPFRLIVMAQQIQRIGNPGVARNVVDFAVTLAPDDHHVLYGASEVYCLARTYKHCDTLMRKAVALAPDNAAYRLHYAYVLSVLREYDRAKHELDIHLSIEPNSDTGWHSLSFVLACQGNNTAACTASERAMGIKPTNREYATHYAGLLIALGRVAAALKQLKRLDHEQPDDPSVARQFSSAYESAGDNDAALEYARRAYALAPDRLEYEQHLEHLEHARGAIYATVAARRGEPGGATTTKCDACPGDHRWNALKTMTRVIMSIMIREAVTRFGGTSLGYLWAIMELVSHLALIAIVFSFMHQDNSAPIGDSIILYYFSGVLPYLLFTNTIMHVQAGVKSSRALLQVPIVKPLDVLLARGILELLTQLSVGVIMLVGFGLYGLHSVPYDIPACLGAMLIVWLFAMGFGVCNSVMQHFFHSWEHVFGAMMRALYFISGIFVSPSMMPPYVRDMLVWNPLLQVIDLFRRGFFGFYDPNWLNIPYLLASSLTVFTIGLGMERTFRRRLSAPV